MLLNGDDDDDDDDDDDHDDDDDDGDDDDYDDDDDHDDDDDDVVVIVVAIQQNLFLYVSPFTSWARVRPACHHGTPSHACASIYFNNDSVPRRQVAPVPPDGSQLKQPLFAS